MTVYTICYNEEFILPHFITHYRAMFPGCRIVVHDNESTDNTRQIALAAGCEVVTYSTGNKLDDNTYLKIKNQCWKLEKEWVIICDADEFCDITADQLAKEAENGATIIRFAGYNMVNHADNMDFAGIIHGVRSESYDKFYCFDANELAEIGFNMGCHTANPLGRIKYSAGVYICRHYKYINIDHMITRHSVFASRLSDENIKRGYGGHYLYTPEDIRNEFQSAKNKSIKVIV